MVCKKCGMSFEGDAAFCPFCGADVAVEAAGAVAAQADVQPVVQPVVQEAYTPPTYAQPVSQGETFQSQPSQGEGMGQVGYSQPVYGQVQQGYAAPLPRSAGSGMGLASLILGIICVVSVPLFFVVTIALVASAGPAILDNPEAALASLGGGLALLPLLMFGGIIAGIIGLVLGIIGRNTAHKVGGLTARATAGLVTSIVGLSIWLLLFALGLTAQ